MTIPAVRDADHHPATAWMDSAACQGSDVDFHADETDPAAVDEAKAVCASCPVRSECLAYAVERREHGVWGGTSEAERYTSRGRPRSMRRRRKARAHTDLPSSPGGEEVNSECMTQEHQPSASQRPSLTAASRK